jgi:hypothetical protein
MRLIEHLFTPQPGQSCSDVTDQREVGADGLRRGVATERDG